MIITQPLLPSLRDSTIRWLAGIIGELQREVARLERENAAMRDQLREAGKQTRYEHARAKAGGR